MTSKERTYRLFSLLMAVYLMVISMGFTVDKHYCQGELKSVALFGKAKSCHDMNQSDLNESCKMESMSCHMEKKSCEHKKLTDQEKDNCCNNETETVQFKVDSEVSPTIALKVVLIQDFIVAFFLATQINNFDTTVNHIFRTYQPPSVISNFRVLYQSFLC